MKWFNKLRGISNTILFIAGDKVTLINDPKQRVYVVEGLVRDSLGLPEISRGPMRQFSPAFVFRVRDELTNQITDFRSDSLQLKSQTAKERMISGLKQDIKERKEKINNLQSKIEEENYQIMILNGRLESWEKQPEHPL
jgi:hypothetical protein